MPSLKVHPPSQLPDRGVSEIQFNIWIEELEVYLSQEDSFRLFLPDEPYAEWEAQENNPDRLTAVKGADDANDATILKKRQRQLRTVLSMVGKCVSQGHYDNVMRHSTSMEWIYSMLRCDYDIQKKGINFFNLLDLSYDPATMTPIAFYNQYRTMITNNLSRKNDVIKYKGDLELHRMKKCLRCLKILFYLTQ